MLFGFSRQIFHFLVSNLPVFIYVLNLFCIVHKHIKLPRWLYFFMTFTRFFSKNARNSELFVHKDFFYIKKVWSPRKYFWLFQFINKVFGSFLFQTLFIDSCLLYNRNISMNFMQPLIARKFLLGKVLTPTAFHDVRRRRRDF